MGATLEGRLEALQEVQGGSVLRGALPVRALVAGAQQALRGARFHHLEGKRQFF